MYYYWGLNGIVPSLILSSIVTLLLSSYFVNKIKIERVVIPYRDIIKEGSVMVKFGIMMTLSSLIFTATTYILALYISNKGSLNDVGLYQAGIAITSKYVGLIFTAMAMDYYPRLSAVNSEKEKVASIVNQQAEVGLLILTPIIILLISTMPLVIRILYTISFLPIVDFVQWVSIGILFKCISWSIGFIVLAKSDSKVFFVTELIANLVILGLNILFYTFLGLEGLGISYLIGYILYLLMMVYVCKNRYDFFFSKEFIKNTLVCLFLSIFAFLIAKVFKYPIAYISGTILLLISIGYSLFILNKRMEVVGWLKSKIKI
jgi:O-antigen/teichoic acid export membrane protein